LYFTADGPVESREILIRVFCEGDDLVGGSSRELSDKRNSGPCGIVISNQESIGYSAKLKCIVAGRAEFVGIHLPVSDGHITKHVPWVPAVGRYLTKIGCHTSPTACPASCASRFVSLSSLFAGKLEDLDNAFYWSAKSLILQHTPNCERNWDVPLNALAPKLQRSRRPKILSKLLRSDGYSEVDRAFGQYGVPMTYSLETLLRLRDEQSNVFFPTGCVQSKMYNLSLFEDADCNRFTTYDLGKVGLFAQHCWNWNKDKLWDFESAYADLPLCIKNL